MITMIIENVKSALKNMDARFYELSNIDYAKEEFRKIKEEIKYLERPFAYEFYHKFREKLDKHNDKFGNFVIQGEVPKDYQNLFKTGKVPDFILHTTNQTINNFAVIEFKLASNSKKSIKDDFEKLLEFKNVANYQCLIEVIIGNKDQIERVWRKIDKLKCSDKKGENITIIIFEVDDKHVYDKLIRYQSQLKEPNPSSAKIAKSVAISSE